MRYGDIFKSKFQSFHFVIDSKKREKFIHGKFYFRADFLLSAIERRNGRQQNKTEILKNTNGTRGLIIKEQEIQNRIIA